MPEVPDVLRAHLGPDPERLARFAALLATDGVQRGLIGPREVPRLWERHLLNCAVITDLFPADDRVVDVGTGAGLPGIVLACVRPDLRIDLVDSLARRTRFLTEAVGTLGLGDRVRVVTGRGEDAAVRDTGGGSRWVTARAVAPLSRLVSWCLPLLRAGGTLVAMKGATAQDEIDRDRGTIRRQGGRIDSVRTWDPGLDGIPDPVARAVLVVRESADPRRGKAAAGRSGRGRTS